MRATVCFLLMFLLAAGSPPQSAQERRGLGSPAGQSSREAKFRPVFDNDSVNVASLELTPRFHAESYQNTHDVVWVALNDGVLSFADSENQKTAVNFRPGDARFFRSFHAKSLSNLGETTFRGVVVELKARGLVTTCGCGASAQETVCGCPEAAHLPQLWAVGLGGITLAGTVLAPGERFRSAVERDDTLLIAVTALVLRDGDATLTAAAEAMRLQPGEAAWLKSGLHRLQNVGNAPARFVTLEF